MRMDDASAEDSGAVTLQDVPAVVSELGALVQMAGESDVVETAVVLILTKENEGPQILECHFVGNPVAVERMMRDGTITLKRLANKGIDQIQTAEKEIDPWDAM